MKCGICQYKAKKYTDLKKHDCAVEVERLKRVALAVAADLENYPDRGVKYAGAHLRQEFS